MINLPVLRELLRTLAVSKPVGESPWSVREIIVAMLTAQRLPEVSRIKVVQTLAVMADAKWIYWMDVTSGISDNALTRQIEVHGLTTAGLEMYELSKSESRWEKVANACTQNNLSTPALVKRGLEMLAESDMERALNIAGEIRVTLRHRFDKNLIQKLRAMMAFDEEANAPGE